MRHTANRQEGMALLVALVMLVVMTMMGITAFGIGKGSVQIVGNMQANAIAVAAAQEAIETAISTTKLMKSPQAVFANGNTIETPVMNDTIAVTLKPNPVALAVRPIKSTELDLANDPEAEGCFSRSSGQQGISGSSTGDSNCANTVWEITAEARDTVTNARAVVTQGIAVRTDINDATSTN